MISALRKILGRDTTEDVNSNPDSSDFMLGDMKDEYREVVASCIQSIGVPLAHVEIEVRELGISPERRVIYGAFVRLARWEAETGPRLLASIPTLERRARKVVNGESMLGKHSHFVGLWFNVPSQLKGVPSTALEMREPEAAMAA
ncbi:MAG: hypothetical protein ABW051_07510 [Burkholderiaceae bacterium]